MNKIAKNLEVFSKAIKHHNQINPGHSVHGIGLNIFDIERLGLEIGEEILPGIILEQDSGVTGNFRILCDGSHNDDLEIETESNIVDAIGEYV